MNSKLHKEHDNVCFLGEHYSIPADLLYYIDLVNYFHSISDGLSAFFIDKNKEMNFKPFENDEFSSFHKEIEQQMKNHCTDVVRMLCEKKIINITVDDYFKKHARAYFTKSIDALKIHGRLVLEAINEVTYGKTLAFNEAASTITGSSVRLFTSSVSTLAVATALEYGLLKRQTNQADLQYQNAVNKIISTSRIGLERKRLDNVVNNYIPDIKKSFYQFAFGLMQDFIEELVLNKKLNGDVLNFVDLNRSNELLKNLSLSPYSSEIIRRAFFACPFNERVYDACIELDLIDLETIKTAKKYCPELNSLKRIIEKNTIIDHNCNLSKEYDRVLHHLPAISLILGKNEEDSLKMLFDGPYNYYKNFFENIVSILTYSNKTAIKLHIKEMFNVAEIFSKTKEQLEEDVVQIVDQEFKTDNYKFLISIGFNTSLKMNIDDIVTLYIKRMPQIIEKYILECKMEHEKLIAMKAHHEKEMVFRANNIKCLENELASMSFFAFKKRKELKHKIKAAKLDIDNFETEFICAYNSCQSKFDTRYFYSLSP